MDDLSPEGRALYDLLKGTIVEDVDKRVRDQKDAMVGAVKKMFAENTALLAKLSEKVEAVRDEIGLEIGQIRLDLDKGGRADDEVPEVNFSSPAQVAKEGGASSASAPTTKEVGSISAPPSSSGFGFHDRANPAYVPPPIRGIRDSNPFCATRFAPVSPTYETAEQFSVGPRVELPRFDGTNPRLWQTRCEEYF